MNLFHIYNILLKDNLIKNIDASEILPNISAKDCDNECQNFKDNAQNLTYCQQVCGIAPIKEVSTCDDKNNIEKDYYFKDLAIIKKDSSLCGKINNANIKLTCQNRITEDIIESQTN